MSRQAETYCMDCGKRVSSKSRRCPKCGQFYAWKFRDKKRAVNELRAEINANMKTFGTHPQCRYCRRDCKSYNAPHSEIIYCPRTANAEMVR